MSEVREISWGSTPLFAVEWDDGGVLRDATFFDRREAEAFAAEQVAAEPEDDHQETPNWVRDVIQAVAGIPERLGEAMRGGRR